MQEYSNEDPINRQPNLKYSERDRFISGKAYSKISKVKKEYAPSTLHDSILIFQK